MWAGLMPAHYNIEVIMPCMPRPKSKATKIAYKILGVPDNIKYIPNDTQRKINHRLLYEETMRAR